MGPAVRSILVSIHEGVGHSFALVLCQAVGRHEAQSSAKSRLKALRLSLAKKRRQKPEIAVPVWKNMDERRAQLGVQIESQDPRRPARIAEVKERDRITHLGLWIFFLLHTLEEVWHCRVFRRG